MRRPIRRPRLPAATTGCRAWSCGRSLASSASTCTAAPPMSIASLSCSSGGGFRRSLTGIGENVLRMHAVGAPVVRRRLVIYTISAGLAGIAGALIAQTTQFVGLSTLSLERSGGALIMLIIGGVGRLYGAFIGVPLYMIAQDRFSQLEPVYWYFWIGLLMVIVVMFGRGGVLGLFDRLRR